MKKGPSSPYPKQMGDEGPIVDLPVVHKRKAKKLFVVINDCDDDIYGNVFSTRLKAQVAIAEYVLRQVKDSKDEDLKGEIQDCYDAKDYNGVMEIWNGECVEKENWDTFSIQERRLDEELPS